MKHAVYPELNPTARRFARALVRSFPKFARSLRALPGGHFEAHVLAPERSRAGALVCLSSGTGDVWVRFAPRNAFYPVSDDARELVRIVRGLLTDELQFVLLSRRRRWSGTTLVRRGTRPVVPPGESARVLSWSGRLDSRVRATRPLEAKASRTAAHGPA